MNDRVEFAYEVNGFEVLAPAVFVGNPAPGGAAVVEVEHGGDGVNAQSVNVALAEPEEGVCDEKVSDLVATVVEDERAPVGVLAESRVCVLVECGAVEAPQGPGVFREVRGNPVHYDADALSVKVVNQKTKVVGVSVARGGRVVVRDLVAPGAAVRVAFEREGLDVREAQRTAVVRERGRGLAVRERA